MNSVSDARRRRLLASALVLPWLTPGAGAQAHGPHDAPAAVLPFDASTWAHLLRAGPRPAAYVFTTTYCSTCPAVFELLHDTLVGARRKVELAAVVMGVGAAWTMKRADAESAQALQDRPPRWVGECGEGQAEGVGLHISRFS